MKLSRDLGLAGVAIGGHEQLAVRGLQLVHPEPAVSVTALSDVLPHRQREAPVPTCRSSRLNLGAVWKDELVSAQPLVRPAVGAPEPGCCIPGRVGRLQRGRGEPPTPATDLGGDYFVARDNPEHHRRALLQLERLGYRVILEPVVT